jgi:hypothetical protein
MVVLGKNNKSESTITIPISTANPDKAKMKTTGKGYAMTNTQMSIVSAIKNLPVR